jgi:hypothetical protein
MEEQTMDDYLNQWHPGYSGAIELELRKDKAHLIFDREHLVNSKPIQMDMLVIKKEQDYVVENAIGKIFRGHNIIEFKSPEDSLNFDTYIKGVGYACIYKANEKHVDEIGIDDITLTFLRSALPEKLLRQLCDRGFTITKPDRGIYYIQKPEHFPVQIIAIKEVDEEKHVWLSSLTDHLKTETARRLVYAARLLEQKGDVDNADAVLQVSMKANEAVYNKMKQEDRIMCEALRELMRPEMEEELARGLAQGVAQERRQGIQTLLSAFQELGLSAETALAQLMDKYQLDGEDAEKYMQTYWNGYKND